VLNPMGRHMQVLDAEIRQLALVLLTGLFFESIKYIVN